MKKTVSRVISFILTLAVIFLTLPVDAFAFRAGEGTVCEAYELGYYKGSDGYYYGFPITDGNAVSIYEYVVFDDSGNGTYYSAAYDVDNTVTTNAREKWYLKDADGEYKHVYCIQPGVPFGTGGNYTAADEADNFYFQNLPSEVQLGIKYALIYGWTEGKTSPVAGTNADDYAFATQIIIWEYQQRLRSDALSRHDNSWGVPSDMQYLTLKGRPAEKCYDWILEKIANHGKIPSFTSASRAGAPSYILKYNPSTQRYTLTLTDTNNTGYPIKTSSSDGITVKQNGNAYTFEFSGKHPSPVTISYKKNINTSELPFLVWGTAGKQAICTGVDDPVQFYLTLATESDGTAKIVKTSEDGIVSGISFEISGNGMTKTVTTGADGTVETDLIPGTYTVTELNPADRYVTPASQTVTITAGATATVTFSNVLKKGNLTVTKASEDGKIENVSFRLHGTSYSGAAVDITKKTDAAGKAYFSDVLIGTYTLEEVNPADRYVTPASQTVTITAGATATVNFSNVLKKGNLTVTKASEDGKIENVSFRLHGTSYSGAAVDITKKTDAAGKAYFSDVLIGTYTLEEVNPADRYVTPASQTVTITAGATATVAFSNVLKKGNLTVTKASEDRKIENVTFRLHGTSYSGAAVDLTKTTDAAGKAYFNDVLIGTYTLEEVNPADRYVTPASQTVTITAGATATVNFSNVLKKGNLTVTKTSEDGKIENVSFRLHGTSYSGAAVDITKKTDAAGKAYFNDVLIGTYTLEEVNPADRYVTPASQTVTITEGATATVNFSNVLKKWTAEVTKEDRETGTPQADATLAGAEYGLYRDGELIDTYITDENGKFSTKEYVCGNYTLKEIKASEGYLLDETEYPVGAESMNFTLEHNVIPLTVQEDIIKGSILIVKHADNGDTQIETPEVGARFEVYLKSSGSYEAAEESYRDLLTADEDGFAQSKELPYGVYTVHQISGWDDYEFIGDFDVYVSRNDKTYKYLINNNAFESYIKIAKYDAETGNMIPVANTGYEIYDDKGNKITMKYMYPEMTETDVFYTNSEGWLITPEKLKIGDYTMVEVAAPYGYVLDSTPVKFRITKAATEQENGQTVISVSQKNIPQKGIITINKSGEILKSVLKTENGYVPVWETAALEGAEFDIIAAEDIVTPEGTLRCKKGDIAAHAVTDAEGKAVTGELYLGKYLITETKVPEGFLKAEDKEIEIIYAGETVVVTEQSLIITDDRQKVSVSLVKKLENSEDDVTKVLFGLYAKEDIKAADGTTISAEELIESAAPDAEGKVIFKSDLPFGRYYIRELETAEGYLLDENVYEINFSYAGETVDVVEITANEGKAVINHKKPEPPEDVEAGGGNLKLTLGIGVLALVFIAMVVINIVFIKKKRR